MRRQLHNTLAAMVLAVLWTATPALVIAQTDGSQVPDASPIVAPGQIYVPGSNPAQSVAGYSTAQPALPQVTTAQPTYTYPLPGYPSQPYYVTPQPIQPSAPAAQPPVNAMLPSYVSRPSYASVVPLGSRPSYASIASPITMSRPVKVSYPSWVTSVPLRTVGQPSYATVQQRGNLGQLPQSNGPQNQAGPFFVVPGSFPPGYFNGPTFAPGYYNYVRR